MALLCGRSVVPVREGGHNGAEVEEFKVVLDRLPMGADGREGALAVPLVEQAPYL
jgi:hypothetical protein